MTLETIALKEPAKSLFATTRDALMAWLPSILPRGTHWAVGGGTILAAQWNHRMSTDIDIFLPGNAHLAALAPAHDPEFVNRMADLGATEVKVQSRGLKFSFPAGRVEVTALDPSPPLAPIAVEMDNASAHRLPNACILAGKLTGRGLRLPMRDVFDVCVAADLDPDALCCAVNQIPEQTRPEIAARLTAEAKTLADEALEEVLQPDSQWARFLVDGPTYVASLLHDLAYTRTEMSFDDGTATICAETRNGRPLVNRYTNPQTLLEGLYTMGLELWLMAHYGTIDAFLDKTEDRLAASRNLGERPGAAHSAPAGRQ